MSDEPKRWIWIDDVAQGPFTVAKMYRMATTEEIGPATLFWSDAKQQWLPMTGVMFDIEPGRLDQMTAAGIREVEMLGSGQNDCAACLALTGRVYSIDSAPCLPPSECACVPWCRLTLASVS